MTRNRPAYYKVVLQLLLYRNPMTKTELLRTAVLIAEGLNHYQKYTSWMQAYFEDALTELLASCGQPWQPRKKVYWQPSLRMMSLVGKDPVVWAKDVIHHAGFTKKHEDSLHPTLHNKIPGRWYTNVTQIAPVNFEVRKQEVERFLYGELSTKNLSVNHTKTKQRRITMAIGDNIEFNRMTATGEQAATKGIQASEHLALYNHEHLQLLIHLPSTMTLYNFPPDVSLEDIKTRAQEVEKLGFDWETTTFEGFNPRELPVTDDSYLIRILKGEMTASEALVESLIGKDE